MAGLTVTSACTGCGACLLTCPVHALVPLAAAPGAARLHLRAQRCTGCGECLEVCPADAIVIAPGWFGDEEDRCQRR